VIPFPLSLLGSLLMAAGAAAPAGQGGRLCVAADCRTGNDPAAISFPAASAERSAVWLSGDEGVVEVLRITAGSSTVRTDRGVATTVRVIAEGRPPSLRYTLRDGASTWTWSSARRSFTLRRPAGATKLLVEADGYRSVEREAAPSLLIVMRKAPVVSGFVMEDKTGLPIAGVRILGPKGDRLATSDVQGRFRAAFTADWPPHVRISAVDFAERIIPLPAAAADTELPPIRLSEGGGILVKLLPPLGGERVWWQLLAGDSRKVAVREGIADGGVREFSIDMVARGRYQLAVKGEDPLQQFALPVTVAERVAAAAEVQIASAVLRLRVTSAGKPADGAQIQLKHAAGWTATMKTDERGEAAHEMWQRGDVSVVLRRPPAIHMWAANKTIDQDVIEWIIEASTTTLRGHVFDSKKNTPVEGAVVVLNESFSKDNRMSVDARTDGLGAFEFSNVPPGTHRLSVLKTGYTEAQIMVQTSQDDTVIERDLQIAALDTRALLVVDERGLPLPSTPVIVMDAEGIRRVGDTDLEGKMHLPLAAPSRGATIFVLPRSGSFAVRRLPGGATGAQDAITIRVMDGSASLAIRARSSDGQPITGVPVFFRVDGTFVPVKVFEFMVNLQGLPMATNRDGELLYPRLPPGQYDLWPIGNRDDYAALSSAAPPPPAASVRLTPGRQQVDLRFDRK
jgi:Carboxypeptidase regulatory-like domain